MKKSNLHYHLKELEVSRNKSSPYYLMPEFCSNYKRILDVGCGIGQTFVASDLVERKSLVGMDVDMEALVYGHNHFSNINFINGDTAHLPFSTNQFDFVLSRVALPYTNILVSLKEIQRVLKPNGDVWFTLHSFTMESTELCKSLYKIEIKECLKRFYVLLNGANLHLFGKLYAIPTKNRYESFQTKNRMTCILENLGFENIQISRDIHFLITAQNGPGP